MSVSSPKLMEGGKRRKKEKKMSMAYFGERTQNKIATYFNPKKKFNEGYRENR
jgi:hypothetical protein